MSGRLAVLLKSPLFGIVVVIVLLSVVLTLFAGTHVDRTTGATVNNFLNANTLLQIATDASFFAIMAIGATLVMVLRGIDLSVGSVYALAGVAMALVLRNTESTGPAAVLVGLTIAVAVGLGCGLLNGSLICALGVHPFVVTLGAMWVYRGIAFVSSRAESVLLPEPLTQVAKSSLGFGTGVTPVPLVTMLAIAALGSIYLKRTAPGRRIFAVGGNSLACRYSGLPITRILVGVYGLAGLAAGLAAFVGNSYYGSASSGDAAGYELYVIASAVVGGVSLSGGRGTAWGALLGAFLIALMRQSIRTLHFDQNYEQIVIGCAIVLAVALDRWSTMLRDRGRRESAAQ
ncbi:MAG TPA: ABC transporter permease [Fimbriimonadaceae bacterium]|nr:ABC transporter permease [Fimbriimonadaceae bacterium]